MKIIKIQEKSNPLTLIKIGHKNQDSHQLTVDDLEFWRKTFEKAIKDPNFVMVTDDNITIEQLPIMSKYDCSPQILKELSNKPIMSYDEFFVSSEETDALAVHLSTRLRSMAKTHHVNAVWRLIDLPWSIDHIKAAVEVLATTGLNIFVDMEDQTIKAFWNNTDEI
jgi:hypothetical protein